MDKTSRKISNQDINPCLEESDASHKCLDSYNYDRSKCSAYFQRYKNCRKYWHNIMVQRRRDGIKPEMPTAAERLEMLSAIGVLLLFIDLLMDVYVDLCLSFGLPVWLASLLHTAERLRSDHARRKKVYRLLQRKLIFHGVGVNKEKHFQPTYVYPEEVKVLLRSVFPKDICDYPNPKHNHVVYITMEDLHSIQNN